MTPDDDAPPPADAPTGEPSPGCGEPTLHRIGNVAACPSCGYTDVT